MNIKYPGFKPTHALFAVFTHLLLAIAWVTTIITLGWIGRYWSCRILYWTLGHPLNVVYDETQEPDEQ